MARKRKKERKKISPKSIEYLKLSRFAKQKPHEQFAPNLETKNSTRKIQMKAPNPANFSSKHPFKTQERKRAAIVKLMIVLFQIA